MPLVKSPILGPDGSHIVRNLKSHYDVGRPSTTQNAEHWSNATSGSANVSFDYETRRKSRLRSRYETNNNPHLRGMVETRSADTIGDGPNLQMLIPGSEEIEAEWNDWASKIGLGEKLITLWTAGKQVDGEGIAIIRRNASVEHDIQLDLEIIESEQMGNPQQRADTEDMYDGIMHSGGRPLAYYIYDEHPDSAVYPRAPTYTGDWYGSNQVCHVFRKYRIGQLRGATELGPALGFAAILRRFTFATLDAAEIAAQISLWLETEATPMDGPATYASDDDFLQMPTTRNMIVTAPHGWHAKQIKSEQPIERYEDFIRAVVTQMGRSIGIPAALSYGDSSRYNMASGRLDFQTYIRAIETDRRLYLEPFVLEKLFDLWLRLYLAEASQISPSSIDTKNYPHRWAYRPINHSDPEKQAAADVALFNAGMLTLEEYLYSRNINPETHYQQLQNQADRFEEIGIPIPGVEPGMVPSDNQDDDD